MLLDLFGLKSIKWQMDSELLLSSLRLGPHWPRGFLVVVKQCYFCYTYVGNRRIKKDIRERTNYFSYVLTEMRQNIQCGVSIYFPLSSKQKIKKKGWFLLLRLNHVFIDSSYVIEYSLVHLVNVIVFYLIIATPP